MIREGKKLSVIGCRPSARRCSSSREDFSTFMNCHPERSRGICGFFGAKSAAFRGMSNIIPLQANRRSFDCGGQQRAASAQDDNFF